MSSSDQWKDKILALVVCLEKNEGKRKKIGKALQVFVGVLLMILGLYAGQKPIQIFSNLAKTHGKIVEMKEEHWVDHSNGSSRFHSSFMPIVEFRLNEEIYRFKDQYGSNSNSIPGDGGVSVIYSKKDPKIALIEREYGNFIPWLPILGLGIFLLFVGMTNKEKGS